MDPISNESIDASIEQRKKAGTKKNRIQRSIKWFSGGLTAALIASYGAAAIKAEASKSTAVQQGVTNLKLDGISPKQGSIPSGMEHPPYKVSRGELTAAQKKVLGTWRLVSWENRDEQGKVTYPFGKDALGYIIYSADGHMCATLSEKKRPNFPGGDILTGTLEEQAKAVQTYIAYCGKYEVKPDRVVHLPDVSLFPNYIGTRQERFYSFKDGKLVLTHAPEKMDGKLQTPFIIWERVPE
ncbi:MAG: lipocalin-like domain-containing protein [Oscillatoriales cyanobacterium]|nr:MAG: lipocalin-like domain-containing protein [Oscillatoriales cyanobacterium]TAF32416.1 MAG: lipocalin-like domain-containing protein [Oscillatoriales cyanobacterium]